MDEVSQEPTRQVNQVHALVQQLSASSYLSVRPPFALVTQTAAMPIAASKKHERAQRSRVDYLPRFRYSWMIAMVEAYVYEGGFAFRRRDHRLYLLRAARRGFLDKDVLASLYRGQSDRSEPIVGRRDDHGVDVGPLYDGPPVSRSNRSGMAVDRQR